MADYPKRKKLRLPDYDYSQPGYYFVTICAHNKSNLFGQIQRGVLRPTRLGIVVREELQKIERYRSFVNVEKWVIMPNHLHVILRIMERPCRDMTCHVRNQYSAPVKDSLWTIIASFKAAVTRR